MTIQVIKDILEQLNFPKRFCSEQTAICIRAMLDKTEREGLLPGHQDLSQGARIHDILNYARYDVGKRVAEYTREAYRKTSLAPLMNTGIIVRHQLSTNDPNTYYRLQPDFEKLFSERSAKERKKLITELRISPSKQRGVAKRGQQHHMNVVVRLGHKGTFKLSPGVHNALEKAVVEVFGHAFLNEPQVVYLGDTAPRVGYQNRPLMRRLNLPIDTAESLPDVILYSEYESHLVIVEVVTSSGPVNSIRLEQLQKFTKGPKKLGHKISYITAFLSRAAFRRFVEEIAWQSSVWLENEPNNIVHFESL
jgi:type II restriction enzyme